MKTNSENFENKVALAAYGVLAILMVVERFSLFAAIVGALLMMTILLWRIVLWELRKKAERRRVIAYWERPGSRDAFHLILDVMYS